MAGEQPHHAKKRKANKPRRNFRVNGQERGKEPSFAGETKYVRSGGPRRCAARKAKHHGCGNPGEHLK